MNDSKPGSGCCVPRQQDFFKETYSETKWLPWAPRHRWSLVSRGSYVEHGAAYQVVMTMCIKRISSELIKLGIKLKQKI